MRMAVLAATVTAAVTAAVALGGCAAEQARVKKRQEDMAAAVLGMPSRSLLRYLGPDERAALDRVGMGGRVAPGRGEGSGEDELVTPDDPAAAEALDDGSAVPGEEPGTTADRVAEVGVSVLQVGVTLGMIAAPFFLF